MLLLAALGIALKLAGEMPGSVFTAGFLAALATLGCVLVGWPELLLERMRSRRPARRQWHIPDAQVEAMRAHFSDDLTMPPSGGSSAADADQCSRLGRLV